LEIDMKILAVDDDPIILELLTQFVLAIGDHDLTTAECGPDALALLNTSDSTDFDCFLFDVQMPVMDGIELTRQLRGMARFADTPVLMLTAMADKRYVDAAFAAGATDYVTKPFEVSELIARLNMVEGLVDARKSRSEKIFGAQSPNAPEQGVELYEPISIYDVENVIDYMAMENYVEQLSRTALFGSTSFAFTVREVLQFHAGLSSFEFYSLISDIAEVISDTLEGHQYLMSYAGNGTFVCITESGWRPEMERLMDAINLTLSQTELYNNQGQRLQPRVSAGEAVRLIWKSGASLMDAMAQAHASAEDASAAFERSKDDFWQLGRTA
jgi:CheY-like chemotaxis protein